MKAGDILDLTLRSMRVVDVKPGSTLLVGSLPNGEPFEVRVPFDADVRTAPVEREPECPNCPPGYDCSNGVYLTTHIVRCASDLADATADHTHRCALYVDAGPHTDSNHVCGTDGCGKQWGGAL